MTLQHGFELIRDETVEELNSRARFFRHRRTGGELLSLENADENKVFGITFRTPPRNSTGIAHILEHSVLCGSRKYPVKEPFVELLKGSLQTFLNAFTFPDKTCYPVASQNVLDFYHLIDVYLDAVFYPRLTPEVLMQEGHHYELENPEGPLTIKGVVYNEMKGVYSSPDSLLFEVVQESLFPDHVYGFDSGGNPEKIPDLFFEEFKRFHEEHYHPSGARVFFWGDDDPERRLETMDSWFREFKPREVCSSIGLQPRFEVPRKVIRRFDAGKDSDPEAGRAMCAVNWLLEESIRAEENLLFHILEQILIGMPASPLRKTLLESGLGEDLAGVGLESELRQLYFSTGLKGMRPRDTERLEGLVLETLENLAKNGIDPDTVAAALNTVEFHLRENNPGRNPRGLRVMRAALSTWLYGEDPFVLLQFQKPLEVIRTRVESGERVFEDCIERYFIRNPHRTVLHLLPEPGLEARQKEEERKKFQEILAGFSDRERMEIVQEARKLKEQQETPDSPEDLARIPCLHVSDLDQKIRTIPERTEIVAGTRTFVHDLFTGGILYLDVGFDLHGIPSEMIPYVPILGKCLVEIGTCSEDYVKLSQRIGRFTGGVKPLIIEGTVRGTDSGSAWLFLRTKAVVTRAHELMEILRDVLLKVRLNNRERFREMVLKEKTSKESQIVPDGSGFVSRRLSARFSEADHAGEAMKGISQIFFLRSLADRVETDWPGLLKDLETIRTILVRRGALICNVTVEEESWRNIEPILEGFLEALPVLPMHPVEWAFPKVPFSEALTVPAAVNYVGKGINLREHGYRFHGSALVISRFLRTSWLWERVRVQGGAYGAFSRFDPITGVFSLLSYRDPNLTRTLDIYDATADFLGKIDLSNEQLGRTIIGTIGDLDTYQLPDARGFTSLLRSLTDETDDYRQRIREEVLATGVEDFRRFGEVLQSLRKGNIVVLGSSAAAEQIRERVGEDLSVTEVL